MQTEDIIIHYADDDMDDLAMFKNAVEKSGKPVALNTYNNGDGDFLKNIQSSKGKKSIVFLDINMPGKSGFEILKEIRSKHSLDDIPVVMYSTSNDQTAINISQDIGANLYAVKPRSFSNLKTLINKIMDIDWTHYKCPPQNFVYNSN